MKDFLYVYLDADISEDIIYVGKLSYERLRGADAYSFCFDEKWLTEHSDIMLCADLMQYSGWQHSQRDVFGCVSDALPDRWGRTLMNRREQLAAKEDARAVRKLSSYDYLLGIDDFSRMGALRFKKERDGEFINSGDRYAVPPLSSINELIEASKEIEKSESKGVLPEKKWIRQLMKPGTSLGGARPKANVINEDGRLCVAKFPSREDDYDVGLCEHFAMKLAEKAGIKCAKTSVRKFGERYHTLISERFDRTEDGRRIHFVSSLSLLGLADGSGVDTGNGYLDIVDFIMGNCADVEGELRQLFRRIAYNICIGNTDDHFRNHGFLLTKTGWTLSPAYDINPSSMYGQALLVTRNSNESDLRELLDASEDYMIAKEEAEAILQSVTEAVEGWEETAKRLGVQTRERDAFGERFII